MEQIMHPWSKPIATAVVLGLACFVGSSLACFVGSSTAYAQTNVALKSGETIELGDVVLVASCRSLLTATPEVEIMDGPPGVAVAIKQAMIVPRWLGCAKPVSGGKLVISANDVEDYSHTRMVLRIKYKTRNGERMNSRHINITLFP